MKEHLLILGGDGFIGSHVVDEALARGLDVSVFDQRRHSRRADVTSFLGDIRGTSWRPVCRPSSMRCEGSRSG